MCYAIGMGNPNPLDSLTPEERQRIAELIAIHGEIKAAKMLGICAVTLCRCLAPVPRHAYTVLTVRARLGSRI
jgi:hypothetical protein